MKLDAVRAPEILERIVSRNNLPPLLRYRIELLQNLVM